MSPGPSDRGGYGSMALVIFDGPDFQQLHPYTRWTFTVMKLTGGPSGLIVEYPPALAMRLAAQTGLAFNTVNEALAELEEDGWIERERNVVWIVGQLRYSPHYQPSNKHHRTAVQTHVAGLPRLPIVRRFVDAYPEYFGDAPPVLTESLPPADAEVPASDDLMWTPDLFTSAPQQKSAEKGDKSSNGKVVTDKPDSLSDSLSRADQLVLEIGRFCRENGCKWRLKTPIDEWAHQVRSEPNYAGIDFVYETRRCNEWHQNKRKSPKAPDQSLRNWYEKAREIADRRFRETGDERSTGGSEYGHISD